MVAVRNGYLVRAIRGGGKNIEFRKGRDTWWLVKEDSGGYGGAVSMNNIWLPREYVGKKVRFKVELLDEDPHIFNE